MNPYCNFAKRFQNVTWKCVLLTMHETIQLVWKQFRYCVMAECYTLKGTQSCYQEQQELLILVVQLMRTMRDMFGHLHRVTLQHVGLWMGWAQIKQHQRGIWIALCHPRHPPMFSIFTFQPCSPFSPSHKYTKYRVLQCTENLVYPELHRAYKYLDLRVWFGYILMSRPISCITRSATNVFITNM